MSSVSGYVRCAIGDSVAMSRSLSQQMDCITRIAAQRGFRLGQILVDISNGSSRGNELQRALALAESGELHARVVTDASRLSRDSADLRALTVQFIRSGCDLVFALS